MPRTKPKHMEACQLIACNTYYKGWRRMMLDKKVLLVVTVGKLISFDLCITKHFRHLCWKIPFKSPKSNCGYKKATWDETEWNIHPPQIPNIKLQIQCHNQVNFNLCHFLYCWLGNSKFQITLLCLYLNLICKQNQRRKAKSVCSVKSLKTDSIFFRKIFMRYHYTHTWQWVLEECNRNYFTLEINNGSKLRCTYSCS